MPVRLNRLGAGEPRLNSGILVPFLSDTMNEQENLLKKDGYAGSVPPPVDGVYNSVAYGSASRVSNMITSLNEEFFVMSWDPGFSEEV